MLSTYFKWINKLCTETSLLFRHMISLVMQFAAGHFVGEAANDANIRKAKSAFYQRLNGLLAMIPHLVMVALFKKL